MATERCTSGELPRVRRPCDECPWRRDRPLGVFPPERWRALAATVSPHNPHGLPRQEIFACHKTPDGGERACASWLAVVGGANLTIRLAVVSGRLPAAALRPGEDWPELFGSYRELAEANGVDPDDPHLRDIP